MKRSNNVLKLVAVFALTYLFALIWFSSDWSESYWTWLNALLGGQRLGLASDLEILSVLLGLFVFSAGVVAVCLLVYERTRNK